MAFANFITLRAQEKDDRIDGRWVPWRILEEGDPYQGEIGWLAKLKDQDFGFKICPGTEGIYVVTAAVGIHADHGGIRVEIFRFPGEYKLARASTAPHTHPFASVSMTTHLNKDDSIAVQVNADWLAGDTRLGVVRIA